MLIKKVIPGFYNGVSQQPASTRLDTQSEIEENMLGTIIDGLMKRPNTEYVAKLTSKAGSDTFIHAINRDNSEKYIMMITGDCEEPVEIFTLNGTKCTVNYDSGKSYFVSETPNLNFSAITVADYTIVNNKSVQCAMEAATPVTPYYEALIVVKRGIQDTDYKVIKQSDSSVLASYTTGGADSPNTFKTTTIANSLKTALIANLGTGWTVEQRGGIIHLKTTNVGITTDFLRVEDTWGNQALFAYPGYAQNFSDLPVSPFSDIKIKITGSADNQFSSYYVISTSEGTWKETRVDGITTTIDSGTMPCKIVRTGVNTFTVSEIVWNDRLIGDNFSAPDPSFIGDYINEVFFFQDRLGFLSGENVILSRASDYFNFFPTTALDVLDDDPIDVAVSTNQVNILSSARSFNENLLLDSNQQQFILTAGSALLTPKTVQIKPITNYSTSPICKPAAVGTNLYFSVPVNNFSTIREYYVAPDTYLTEAADITAHVDKYLPGNINRLEANDTTNMLFAFSPTKPDTLYHYSFLWQGNEKIQSAWNKWIFDDSILGFVSMDSYLYLLMKYQDIPDICLVKMALSPIKTANLNYRIYLDKQVTVTGVYDAETNTTIWTLPYTDSSEKFLIIDSVTGQQIINCDKASNTTYTASGEYINPCVIGKVYIGLYRFSEWFIKDDNGVADLEGRLQLKKLLLQFVNTGPFKIKVTSYRREPVIYEYSGFVLGESTFDNPLLQSGQESFIILANARKSTIDLICDNYLPSQFILAEFMGLYQGTARRI